MNENEMDDIVINEAYMDEFGTDDIIPGEISDNNLSKHLDVFKEIGNIGAGHAASALAGLLDRRISMSVPEASVLPFTEIVNVLDGPETTVAGVLIDVSGDLNGYILLLLSMEDAMAMVAQALHEEERDTTDPGFALTELEKDTLLEIANILVGSFLSAITSFSGLGATPTVPQLAIDMFGAILSIAMIEYGKIGDSVLFLKTQFNDLAGDINGHFFLIPDYNSYKILLNALGLDE
ncbi:MAG: chemotaxis protein CheC [Oscillospiraceae bacterium]|nr:chemotaxis protein CheC [Oscillospiraceae bacterium]